MAEKKCMFILLGGVLVAIILLNLRIKSNFIIKYQQSNNMFLLWGLVLNKIIDETPLERPYFMCLYITSFQIINPSSPPVLPSTY